MDDATSKDTTLHLVGVDETEAPILAPQAPRVAANRRMPMPRPIGRRVLVEALPRSEMIQPLTGSTMFNPDAYALIVLEVGPGELVNGLLHPVEDIEEGDEVFLVAGASIQGVRVDERSVAVVGADMISSVWRKETPGG